MAFMENDKIVEKVAEYLSIAPYLSEFSPDGQYQRANQLALEPAVWLDADFYQLMGQSIGHPSTTCNPGTVICDARKRYGNSKPLSSNLIIFHAPSIGKKEK